MDESDLTLWQKITRTVTPMPGRTDPCVGTLPPSIAPASTPSSSTPSSASQAAPTKTPVSDTLSRRLAVRPQPTPTAKAHPSRQTPHELRHGDGAGMDRRTHDRFRRGRMAIEARLDLHGMTRDRAHAVLSGFLHRSQERGARCVLVVTGKGTSRDGGGVLRREVPHWLNQSTLRQLVLGIAHAQPRDGGEGAIYVLLKRRRQGNGS